ncbi:hypothetical protein [Jeotgalibacillus campisalis]|uniref:Uncharacterized protein n=1 Tax=Jeotgalibacillus campisalis TaxID=220754 RepID=A0A0C2VF16_9BACL|nr:hypothetical protein [Jeotgalibacillus campisalis]KIL43111.1 hypothetical protein KR50_35140 [Jeotgalibacillus campisalis]
MAKQNKVEAVVDGSRPHPLTFFCLPLFFGVVSIFTPVPSLPYTVFTVILLTALMVFAILAWLKMNENRLIYNLYLSSSMFVSSIIFLVPGVKTHEGHPALLIILGLMWSVVFFVVFFGEQFLPSGKFPLWLVISALLFFLIVLVFAAGGTGYGGVVYPPGPDEEHYLVEIYGYTKGMQIASFLYSLGFPPVALMASKTIWTTRKKLGI